MTVARKGILRQLRRLLGDRRGLALTEFAYSLPIFTGLGMYGLEVAHFTVTQMRVSQAALNLADNASRMSQANNSQIAGRVYESTINQVLAGAGLQGEQIDLLQNGRIILSSLERTFGVNVQFIAWQRCKGAANYTTKYYNPDTQTRPSDFDGMGLEGTKIQAQQGEAVMFVEIIYDYEPLFGTLFYEDKVIRHQAAFNVRDDRNLATLVAADATASRCNVFLAT